MANHGRLPLELLDGFSVVICNLLNPLAGKDLWVFFRLLDGLRVIWPARRDGCIAVLFKECTPAIPTGCEEIEAVYEDNWLLSFRIGAVDLLLFMGRKHCHI